MCKNYIGTATMACLHGSHLLVKGVKIPCNSWSCEECAKRKSIILGNRVKDGFDGKRIRFCTLTARTGLSLVQMLKSLKASWNRLRLALSRRYGLKTYFWVLECGKSTGRPHLHILLDCYVPQRTLSNLAVRAGFGSIVDIREVKDGGGFGYVFKYLGKDCGSKLAASCMRLINSRRYGTSRNIPPAAKGLSDWQCIDFLKDELSEKFREASVMNVSGLLGAADGQLSKNGTVFKWEGTCKYDEEMTKNVIDWLRCKIIDRYDVLIAGGYDAVSGGGNYIASLYATKGELDEVPF